MDPTFACHRFFLDLLHQDIPLHLLDMFLVDDFDGGFTWDLLNDAVYFHTGTVMTLETLKEVARPMLTPPRRMWVDNRLRDVYHVNHRYFRTLDCRDEILDSP